MWLILTTNGILCAYLRATVANTPKVDATALHSASMDRVESKAKEELRQQTSEIIIDTTQKILGDEISPEKHDAILKKAAEDL